jgi:hypothetical protein
MTRVKLRLAVYFRELLFKLPLNIFDTLITTSARWQQCLEKAQDEFSRAMDVLENIKVQHEAAKELDISAKVMKSEKIKTYFAALNQIYTVASRILRSISTDPSKYGSLASPMGASLPFLVDQTSHKWKSLQEKAKSLGYEHVRY